MQAYVHHSKKGIIIGNRNKRAVQGVVYLKEQVIFKDSLDWLQ